MAPVPSSLRRNARLVEFRSSLVYLEFEAALIPGQPRAFSRGTEPGPAGESVPRGDTRRPDRGGDENGARAVNINGIKV